MKNNDRMVNFLYATKTGRILLSLLLKTHADLLVVRFLRSHWSRPFVAWYAKHYDIPLTTEELQKYSSFRDFFARKRETTKIDITPVHLISPCDGWLRAYPIEKDSSFRIKGSRYRVSNLLEDEVLAKNYEGGTCLVIRLRASDYHRYCYIDDGYQSCNHIIPGLLHSVQPIACETYPVFTLNRRCWCLLATENFGPVVQTEIGALVVGGIINRCENNRFLRGSEKGHFDLAGSTIVLLFEPGRIRLRPEIKDQLDYGREVRVELGSWIATQQTKE